MKVKNKEVAPDFIIGDINGDMIQLSKSKGQKVHLIFFRFAACPFCNLRFHEINSLSDSYKKGNVQLISIFESSPNNLKAMIEKENFYSILIPDYYSSLYQLYDLDRSYLRLLEYLILGGGFADAIKGKKLFKSSVMIDGHPDRVGAEFLIDELGNVVKAHYGKTPGDNLPIEEIKKFIQN